MTSDHSQDALQRIAAVPRVNAISPTGPAGWRTVWTGRHTRVALIAFPVFYLIYGYSAGSLLPGNTLVLAALVLAAVLAALAAATYVPVPGGKLVLPGPCAAGAVFPIILAMFLFQGAVQSPLFAVASVVLVGVGLAQRIFGVEACS